MEGLGIEDASCWNLCRAFSFKQKGNLRNQCRNSRTFCTRRYRGKLRNEYRYYAKNGESFVTDVALVHDGVAPVFSAEKLENINKRVQSGQAWYPDFVKEGAAAGCAYYIVYLYGRKVRYFGRDGDEYIQHFPGSR